MLISPENPTHYITRDYFRRQVEKYVIYDSMSYAEAVVQFCSEREIDVEDVNEFVDAPLRSKLEAEAMNRNVIKKTTATLEF